MAQPYDKKIFSFHTTGHTKDLVSGNDKIRGWTPSFVISKWDANTAEPALGSFFIAKNVINLL